MGHLLNHSPTSLNQGAMGGKEEGQQVFNLRNGWNFHFLPSPSIQPNLLWCHLPTEIRFLSIALPQLSGTSSSVKGRLTAFLQRNDHQKWKYCHFLLGQLWLTSQAMGKQEQWPASDWFALSEMWEVHPISQPIHWGGKKEAEMTLFSFLPGEQCQGAVEFVPLADRSSKQVQWKLSKSWCNNKDHVGTYKLKMPHLNEGILSF